MFLKDYVYLGFRNQEMDQVVDCFFDNRSYAAVGQVWNKTLFYACSVILRTLSSLVYCFVWVMELFLALWSNNS